MNLLSILFIVFALSLLILKIRTRKLDWRMAGNIAMCVMLFYTALGHFLFVEGMAKMIPIFVPFKETIVIITGVMEAVMAICLLFNQTRRYTAIFLIVFFILILPSNISAAIHHVDLQKNDFTGDGPAYLWFRIPLQFVLIVWVWYFSLKAYKN